MASTFAVLADPSRREILDLLRAGERPVGDLVDRLTLTQPTVSKHLKVLREAGLVDVRQEAQRRWYRIRPAPLAEVDAWLAPYRRMWENSLDALERHLDAMPDDPTPPGPTPHHATPPDPTPPDPNPHHAASHHAIPPTSTPRDRTPHHPTPPDPTPHGSSPPAPSRPRTAPHEGNQG